MVSLTNPQPSWIETTAGSTQPQHSPIPSAPSSSLSAPASMEAILARIARLEARLEAKEQRWASAFSPTRAEADPPFGLPLDWRLPTWDPGSHQTTTPAATTLATSLPAVQHQPLPAYYDAARPQLGFRYPCSRSSAFIVSEPPAYSESYGGGGSSYEYGVSRNHGGGSYSHYGGGYSGGSYTGEHNPYVPAPPPPRDGYYVPVPQSNPSSYTQPQQPWDSPDSLTTPNDPQFTTAVERETVAEREREGEVTEMADEEGGFSMAENEEESLCAAARYGELETINSLIAAGADVTGVNGDDLIFYGKGSSEGFQEEEERREFQSETDARVLDVDHPWWKRMVVSQLSLYSQAKEVDSFWCVLISAGVMGVVIIGHHGHKKMKRYALEGEVDMCKKPMINAEEVILEVWRRWVIFGLYALEEVYKDLLNLHLEDKVILKGGGVDTLII